jgi:hypothetical protein
MQGDAGIPAFPMAGIRMAHCCNLTRITQSCYLLELLTLPYSYLAGRLASPAKSWIRVTLTQVAFYKYLIISMLFVTH